MSHVDEGTLHAYLDGELAPVERERVDTHLKGCPACQARLAEERAIIERASRLLGMATPPERAIPPLHQLRRPPVVWRLRRPLAWAATVVLAVGLGWLARGSASRRIAGLDEQSTTRAESATAPVTTPAAVATVPGDQEVQLKDAKVPGRNANRERAADRASGAGVPNNALAMRQAPRDLQSQDKLDTARRPTSAALDTANAVATGATASVATIAVQPQQAAAESQKARPVTIRGGRAATPAAAAPEQPLVVDGVPLGDAASGVITLRTRRATPIMSTTWPIIARRPARDVLGVEPVVIPGFAVRAYRRNPAAREIVVEQVTDAGTTISLIERRVDSSGYADEGRTDSAAANAPQAMAKAVNERLARFVGLLRVEIDGPLTPDSLSSLLELAR
jgi:Putative zinc-finger